MSDGEIHLAPVDFGGVGGNDEGEIAGVGRAGAVVEARDLYGGRDFGFVTRRRHEVCWRSATPVFVSTQRVRCAEPAVSIRITLQSKRSPSI